jgi:hypothetical protein
MLPALDHGSIYEIDALCSRVAEMLKIAQRWPVVLCTTCTVQEADVSEGNLLTRGAIYGFFQQASEFRRHFVECSQPEKGV